VALVIPLRPINMPKPVVLIKLKKLPLRNINESKVVSNKYKD
jgi:hypothetical protein